MRSVPFFFSLLLIIFFMTSQAAAQEKDNAYTMLQEMRKASTSLNYELNYYIEIIKGPIKVNRYQHALINGKQIEHLLHLNGPRAEIIQRDKAISYFEPNKKAISLPGKHIVDAVPPIIFADFHHLSRYYDYSLINMQKRIADRLCQGVRVAARDGSRYNYIVWIEKVSKLPLQIDLINNEGNELEKFVVVTFTVGEKIKTELKNTSQQLPLPQLLQLQPKENVDFEWQPTWLPEGAVELSRSRSSQYNSPSESSFYSDGLFSFSIEIAPKRSMASSTGMYFATGRYTVLTETRNNTEIIVVGEIPVNTAKRIATSVIF